MIVLGRVIAPFGIKGWLKIQPFADDPQSWGGMPQWWIAADADAPMQNWRALSPRQSQQHGMLLVAQFDEIDSRTAAEGFKGWFVAVPREAMPDTGKDEYYWGDLIGLPVETLAGEVLGTVASLLSTGAHDVLCVQADGEDERLIPFVSAYVMEVDLSARRIRVDWQKDW